MQYKSMADIVSVIYGSPSRNGWAVITNHDRHILPVQYALRSLSLSLPLSIYTPIRADMQLLPAGLTWSR